MFADSDGALLTSGLPGDSDLPTLTSKPSTDVGLLDDEEAAATSRPALKANRAARMAALDPNDGISL